MACVAQLPKRENLGVKQSFWRIKLREVKRQKLKVKSEEGAGDFLTFAFLTFDF